MLQTIDLCKTFGALAATRNVGLHIEKGTIHSIIGPNGAGKTTLFNLLAGVFPPTSRESPVQGKGYLKTFRPSALQKRDWTVVPGNQHFSRVDGY